MEKIDSCGGSAIQKETFMVKPSLDMTVAVVSFVLSVKRGFRERRIEASRRRREALAASPITTGVPILGDLVASPEWKDLKIRVISVFSRPRDRKSVCRERVSQLV